MSRPRRGISPKNPRLRDLVLARDGHQCTVPGCTERENLDAHHVRWRRHGGRTTADNLTTICGRHHGSAHDGTIRIAGSVSSGLRFSTRDGKPLDEMTHVGHREGPELDPELEAILREEIPEPAALDVPPVDRGLVCLDDIPRAIDAAWWRRFGGLFEWARNRRTLQFRPGPGGSQWLEARDRAGADRGERLSDLVEHTEAIARLEAILAGARATGEVPKAILFTGMAGLGKTTLAHGYAGEAGSPLHATHGGTLDDPTSLLGLLAGLGRGHVLFIDEAHAVPRQVLEFLYTAIEGRYVDLLVAQGTRTREVRLELEPFTLIAATTDEGRLPQPLMTRFDLAIELDPLDDTEMDRLLEQTTSAHGIELQPLARTRLVQASRGIPRQALSLVFEAARASRVRGGTCIELVDAHQALTIKGLDERGLSRVELKILALLGRHGRAMGLEHLAARLGKSAQAIVDLYEPGLLRAGLIQRTPFGRKLSDAARGAPSRAHAGSNRG